VIEEPPLGAAGIVDSLESALVGVDPIVRQRAADALGSLRAIGGRTLSTLARVSLADRDSSVRASAVNALTDIGASEVSLQENAIGLLTHPDQTVRARAAWAIGKLDPAVAASATSRLSELLAADPAIDARFGAAWAFGRMRLSSREAVEALKRALRDPEGDVRAEAARAVGRTGPAAAGAVPGLVSLLIDGDPFAREQAAIALGRVSGKSAEVVDALRTLVLDPIEYVRKAASASLESPRGSPESGSARSRMGGPTEISMDAQHKQAPTVLELEERLLDQDDFARAEASWQLAKIGARASEGTTDRLVIQALVDRDSDARWAALFSIARIAKRSPEVTRSALRILVSDRDPDVRQAAAAAVGALWREVPGEAVAGLAAALNDKDALVREDAAEALGAIGPRANAARESLQAALNDPHGGVRARASESLRLIAVPS
jgi:HEAT repeat protein